MHPAPSIIAFTTLSGLGFGLMFWLGLGQPDVTGWVAFVFYAIAYALACGGLLASTFHLGHPERALKAFTQWRSSWLSREAWVAVIALGLNGLHAIGTVFFGTHWALIGWLGAAAAMITVFATSMIYAQLKTVPRWNHWHTPILFLLMSLSGGALLAGQMTAALYGLSLTGAFQIIVWMIGDRRFAERGHTLGTATGLGDRGDLRLFEPPHTGTNYLLSEMVYVVGRKHVEKLRIIAIILMTALPILLLLLPFSHGLAAIAVLSHIMGALTARWLFFAEAEHVVGLYYDAR
ncbi:MAG: DmsC/YnfH family molybdoenzyme membrane anchor subunit [Pseudomonadota bacterium]